MIVRNLFKPEPVSDIMKDMYEIGGCGTMKVLVVAPYHGLGELIKQMTSQYGQLEVTVVIADMKESLDQIRSFGRDGYDAVISRGGTARLLARHSKIPVVEIQVSGFDVLRMLTLMKDYQAKLRLIGFPNIIQSFVSVSNLLDYDFPYTVIDNENEVENAIAAAKADGVQVIVGDTVTVRLANELGMQGVLITSGRESVAEAFRTAELICRSLEEHKKMSRIYERVIQEGERETAVLDSSLNVLLATEGIKSLWGGAPSGDRLPYRLEPTGFLGELLAEAGADIRENGPLTVYEPVQRMILVARLLNLEDGADLYLLTLNSSDEHAAGVRIIYPYRDLESFPSLLQATGTMDQALRKAKKQLEQGSPVAVYGEQGTGRRIFAGALASLFDKDMRLTEIEVRSGEEAAFRRTCHLISKTKPDSLLHIRGFQHFSPARQRKLADLLKTGKFKLLFSFDEHPKQLKGESRVDARVLEWMGTDAVRLLPLLERPEELEELVRAFLSLFNEKYGKQIVGIRPDAWKLLREKAWKGNLIELRDTMDVSVREAEGEYIGPNDVELSAGRAPYPPAGAAGMPVFDLNQSLEQIERDVIRYVLEEEDMNQSKAAKRLKINRATLWRKLKGNE